MVSLEIRYGDGRAETRELGVGRYLVGREAGDVVLGDPLVSSRHAELVVADGSLTFTDLQSTNGSFLGGNPVAGSVSLQQGQVVRLGGCTLTVRAFAGALAMGRTVVATAGDAEAIAWGGAVGAAAQAASPASAPGGGFAAGAPIGAPQGQAPGWQQPQDQGPSGHPPQGQAPGWQPPQGQAPGWQQPQGQAPGWQQPQGQAPGWQRPQGQAPGWQQPQGQAPGGQQPQSPTAGSADGAIEALKESWALVAPRLGQVAVIYGMFFAPVAVVSIFVALLAGVGLGFLAGPVAALSVVVSIAAGVGAVLVSGGLCAHYALRLQLGVPVTVGEAWKLFRPQIWPFFLTSLIVGVVSIVTCGIGGLLLGCFFGPLFLVEGRRNADVFTRNFELFKVEFVGPVIAMLAFCVVSLGVQIASWIVAYVPLVGPALASVLWLAWAVVALPVYQVVITNLYFRNRQRLEGVDPRPAALARLEQVPA